jgi:hypothetical protein
VHPERFDIPQDNAKLPVFGITSTYDYEAAYKTKIKFSYNMWKFYKRMESSGTKHGFFSSRSWSHITEDRNDGDSFTADWSESDPDNVVPDDQKRIIEQQVKAELIERVLKQFYHPTFSAGISMPSAGTPPTAGAVVIANGIMRTCGGFSFWCSGASFVLKGLYSIFGSSSTEATLQQNYNFTATETWNRETVRYKPAVSVMMETKK